jgi:four helix bundle protein
MATFTSFEKIECWQKARALTKRVYQVSSKGSFLTDYSLRNQIRRASVSIMSNIAEGFDRSGNREFIQFLATAKASAAEVRCQLYVALDQNYITSPEFGELSALAAETGRMTGGLIRYLKSSRFKGDKYKAATSK